MHDIAIAVVKLSDAFGSFWHDLGSDLGATVRVVNGEEGGPPRNAAAILLAAGGAETEALQWLERHEVPRNLAIFVVGTEPGRRTAIRMMRGGSRDYFALPDDLELLRNAVGEQVAQRRGRMEELGVADDICMDAFEQIVGESPAIKEVLWPAARLLPHANATALILGETGTGKELLARALHTGGPRRNEAFVAVNCSALPENLVESELFGHERGAFTNAHAAKPGLFEVADGGTLFLDELGELPLEMQAKLLRVLDEREVRRVGGTKTRKIDVRIIAATNKNPELAVQAGEFREDLYYRLSTIILSLPPLRNRDDDVITIAESLLERAAKQHNMPTPCIGADARSQLRAHHWPGNVRELKNVMERALLLSPPGELFLDINSPQAHPVPAVATGVLPFPAPLAEINKAAARATLEACHGNRSESARQLRISRKRLRGLLEGEPDLAGELSA